MAIRAVARPVLLTTVRMALVILVVVALRGYLPGTAPRQPISAPAVAPVVVFAVAIAIAALAALASWRYRRPLRRSAPSGRRLPTNQHWWQTVAWLMLAAALTLGVLFLIAPHRAAAPRPPTSPTQTATPTAVPPAGTLPPGSTATGSGSDLWPTMLVALPVLLVLLGAGALASGRRASAQAEDSQAAGEPPRTDVLVRAAELGLATVTEPGRDPRAAIIACYVVMEDGLAEAPGAAPQVSDTPSEVLARAVERGVLHGQSAADLAQLFTEARFSRHEMTEHQRDLAAALLRQVLDDLSDGACVPSP